MPIQLNRNSDNLHLHDLPFENDPANLISLTSGVRVPQFDEAVWVPVPKFGQYLVHFLRQEPTLAERYHNVLFEGTAVTSGRLLLARFAWATFKNAQKALLSGFRFFRPQKDDGTVPAVSAGRKGVKQMKKDGKPAGGGHSKGKKRERPSDEDSEYTPSAKPVTDTIGDQGGGLVLRSADNF